MSETKTSVLGKFIELTAFRKDEGEHRPIIVNSDHIVVMGGKKSIQNTGDLKTTECTFVKLFGDTPFLVSETIDEVRELIRSASGAE